MSDLLTLTKQKMFGHTTPRQQQIAEQRIGPKHIYRVCVPEIAILFDLNRSLDERIQELEEQFDGVNGLIEKIQSDPNAGITGDERDIERRHHFFGKNQKPAMIIPSFWHSLKDAIEDRIIVLLGICATLSIIFGMIYSPRTGWWPGVTIFIAVFLMVLITAIADYDKDKRFIELKIAANESQMNVVRGRAGEMQSIRQWDLCVGDIVKFGPGDYVPVDCVIVSSTCLQVDEAQTYSATSGRLQKSYEDDPFLLSDTFITAGTCVAVVAAVGIHSTRQSHSLKAEKLDDTPLQNRLFVLSKTFTFIGIIASLIIFVTSIVVVVIQTGVNSDVGGRILLKKLCEDLTLCIILIIVAIPEGLPMSVAVSLAHTTKQMQKIDSILVRNLTAPEKMAQVNEMVVGLTGTVTTGEMEVSKIYSQNITIATQHRKDTLKYCALSQPMVQLIEDACLFCNEAHIEISPEAEYTPVGSDTEASILRWLKNAETDIHTRMLQRIQNEKAFIPFDPVTRRQIVAIKHPAVANTVRVFMKGAPESVVKNCVSHFNETGNKEAMGDEVKTYIRENIMKDTMSKEGLRTIAFSYKDYTEDAFKQLVDETKKFTTDTAADQLASDHTLICLLALDDPLRKDVNQSITYAKVGGVNVRLATNNSLEYAISKAVESGIINDVEASMPGVAMLATELRTITGGIKIRQDGTGYDLVNQIAFNNAIEDLKVLARATSEDKLILAVGLKNLGQEVAMVGDSISDVQAFENSCVSLCMGSGPALARQSADFVLLNPEFEKIMRTLMYGRNIYTNIRRFLQFQVTCNFTVLLLELIGICYFTESPLNAVQLLWINLVMDTFAALALATTPPMTPVIFEPVVNPKSNSVLNKTVWRQIYGVTIWNVYVLCLVIFGGKATYDLEYSTATQTTDRDNGSLTQAAMDKKTHFTVIFNTLFWLCWFNEINCRVMGPREFNVFKLFFSSPVYILMMSFTAFIQWSSCHWLSFLFQTSFLTPGQFWRGFFWGITVLIVAFLLKLMPVRWTERMKVGINEEQPIGQNSKLMKSYEKTKKSKVDYRKMRSPKKTTTGQDTKPGDFQKASENLGDEEVGEQGSSQPLLVATGDKKDDNFVKS